MRAIFISYRRDDTEGQAGRLFKDLSEAFGEDAVFMDVTAIQPGVDFRKAIEEHIASCGVVLTLIGRDWLAPDSAGRRRIDDANDFVRLETASALRRDIPVIPVLVKGAHVPRPEELPDDLRDLAFRNAVEISHARWDSDVQLLVNALRPILNVAASAREVRSVATPRMTVLTSPRGPASGRRWAAVAFAAAAVAIVAGVWIVTRMSSTPAQMPEVSSVGATRAKVNQKLSQIADFCKSAISGRYPFSRSSDLDVTQEDFHRLFAPGGLFDDFIQHELKEHIDTGARPWTFRRTADQVGGDTSAGLMQLQRAQLIRDAFFPAGAGTMSVRFELIPIEMDASITQFVLDIHGQTVRYAHGPQARMPVLWPGAPGKSQIRLQITRQAGEVVGLAFDGPWALFRLLDRAQIKPGPQPGFLLITFLVDGRRTVLELIPASAHDPFGVLEELQQFQCPTSL